MLMGKGEPDRWVEGAGSFGFWSLRYPAPADTPESHLKISRLARLRNFPVPPPPMSISNALSPPQNVPFSFPIDDIISGFSEETF